ncbi:glycosyltransferase family 4 protein [Sphingobacterium sp. SYP-B4668]|uniref:glycosyltransferase family 4 protein n=1 Tax=Sphingobacterium sp. SYP-B4668 TaxID=2996035 RepID=UPI0022DE5415|nr:glycosyltransferase family 1 protein [Sphingobacterium sp. SYP-B4668]
MKTIVVSAVNLNVGGTLTILRDCLQYLSLLARQEGYRVIAIVHKKELADYPYIEYIENQWPKKRWINRLWFEYVSLKKVSRQIGDITLWLSLHDTTPNVFAKSQAVYCHNPFPFYKWSWRECLLAPKIVMFSLFSSWIYKKGIRKNKAVIVQQQWLRDEFFHRYGLSADRVILALPDVPQIDVSSIDSEKKRTKNFRFICASSANSHKNFECLCQATKILEQRALSIDFEVCLTISGDENNYARWLYRKWGRSVKALKFIGFQNRKSLFSYYKDSECLIFPSKVETWGLPISEFAVFDKPMLLSDTSYARETAAGSNRISFFDADNPIQLAEQMRRMLEKDTSFLAPIPSVRISDPVSHNWEETFQLLLKEENNASIGEGRVRQEDQALALGSSEGVSSSIIGISHG